MKYNNLWNELKNRNNLALLSIYGYFFFTMIFQLMHSALWGDEWNEYKFSQTAIRTGEMYGKVISTFQPPLYNFVMHFWLKVSQSLLWFRLFNVFVGMASGIFLYLTVKKLSCKYVAMVSVIALGSCYQWIYCIQECSEYAIMLFFLFVGLYFYMECIVGFSYRKMVIFILANVCAIYSQYGSIFVTLPMLLVFYVGIIFLKKYDLIKKIIVTISYLICFVGFALPLYVFFLKKQMERNQISSHIVHFTFDSCKDIFFNLGRIIGYLFNLNSSDAWNGVGAALTIGILIMSVYLILKGELSYVKKSLIVAMWIGYFAHYFLTQSHIYAMVHANISAGFYARYSYFYMPILFVVLPMIFYNIYILESNWQKKVLVLMEGAGILCLFLSFYALMGNWHKAKDDQYAEIWLENNGWEDTTYLLGVARDGFNYVKRSDGYQESYINNVSTVVDVDNLPEKFWVWRTNWGGDHWQTVVDKANSLGYTVTIYDDSGYIGQLAYCEYEQDN